MPQHASRMGQPLPKGLAGAFALYGHNAALRQILGSLLTGSRLHLTPEAIRSQPRSSSQLATQIDIAHDRKV